jgi:hypothetical protein
MQAHARRAKPGTRKRGSGNCFQSDMIILYYEYLCRPMNRGHNRCSAVGPDGGLYLHSSQHIHFPGWQGKNKAEN